MSVTEKEEFAMSMFAVHSIQAESWAFVMKGKVRQEFKFRLEAFLSGAKLLRSYLEKEGVIEVTDDLGESVSQIFEVLHKSKDGKAQKEMLQLLSEYASGEIKIVDPSQLKETV